MSNNAQRGFRRLYIVLSCAWATYCLLVYPMQQLSKAEEVEKTEFRTCWEQPDRPDFKDCAAYARVKAGTSSWMLKNYWEREWLPLALVVVVIPLAIYGVIVWIWRGFSPA